ncbi:MAG: thiamine phosphate synthase, partial [Candidatus Cloacimonadota bacterium]|nr:thiamine phosphate synthase [Candidatus Cloacimonadota bacterium]
MKNKIGLYLIIDGGFTDKFGEIAELAVKHRIRIIQYRHKNASHPEMLKNAKKIATITENTDTLFIMNDNLQVALESGADGLHIGQSDIAYTEARKHLPEKIIGVSSINLIQSQKAENNRADYLGIGPVFATTTKLDTPPAIGTKKLSELVKNISIPIVAIGGINLNNAFEVLQTGVSGIAVISAILGKPDPEKEIIKFM